MGRKIQLRKWSEPNMQEAYEAVKSGTMSITAAARRYSVPRMTLSDRVSGKVKMGAKIGVQTALTTDEENALVNYIEYMAQRGFPLSVEEVLGFAYCIAKEKGKGHIFNKTGPSRMFWRGFKKRHPTLSLRRPDALDKGRASMGNVYAIRDYFELLKETLDSNQLNGKPSQIYNCDEAALYLNKSAGQKVVVPVRFKHSHSVSCATSEHISVHCCVNAAGSSIPPMMIFSKTLPGGAYHREGPINASYACSESGFMDQNLYLQWFEKTFLAHAVPQRPLLLIQDGASSHISAPLIRSAIANDVILLCLPPKTTHIPQPLDVAVYRKMKLETTKVMKQAKLVKSDLWVSKRNVSGMFKIIFERSFAMSCITEGFRKCGIYPFNPNAIDKSLLLRSSTEVSTDDLDLSPKPKESSPSSVSSATSAAAQTHDTPPQLHDHTYLNGQHYLNTAGSSNDTNTTLEEDVRLVFSGQVADDQLPTASDIVFQAEPLNVTTEPLGILDFQNSFTSINLELDQSFSSTVGEVSFLVDEDGILTLNPSSVPNEHAMQDCVPELNVGQDCPPELALAAVESGLTPRKKRKYEHSYTLGSDLPNDNCYKTWKALKQKVTTTEDETKNAKYTDTNSNTKDQEICEKTPDVNKNVSNHRLVKAGLIPSDLVDILVVPQATSGQKRSTSKVVKKARVLTSEEVQKEVEEKEQLRKEQIEIKAKRQKERELKRLEKEAAAARRKEELKIKKELREKAKTEKLKSKPENVKSKIKKIQEERDNLLRLRRDKVKAKIAQKPKSE